jgi:hypothetical protein
MLIIAEISRLNWDDISLIHLAEAFMYVREADSHESKLSEGLAGFRGMYYFSNNPNKH